MKRTLLFLFCLISVTLFAGNKTVDKAQQAKAKEWVKNQPLEFVENKGQFTNTDGKPADEVLFKATYGSCDIYITTSGLSYVFVKTEDRRPKSEVEVSENTSEEQFRNGINESEEEKKIVSYYRLDMNLLGANINKANIIKENESRQGHYNYFYAHCPQGIYDVKGYGKITIKNIYPGIDWVIYTNANSREHPFKYDFVVHPKADYKAIRIKFVNAQNTSLTDNDTKLNIHTIAGNIEEGNLFSYQTNSNNEISSKYAIKKDTIISIEISDYDTTKTLVIDPLVWATYYGGAVSDQFTSICSDNNGNIYITGGTGSANFPVLQQTGSYWQTNSGGVIILKFNNQGVRLWAAFYGTANNVEIGHSICLDSHKNIYITGYTTSGTFPTQQLTAAFWQSSLSGNSDAFILKFDSLGVRQWATFIGGSSNENGRSLYVDSQDNLYLVGTTYSANFPLLQLTGAYYQSTITGSYDTFISKFNSFGVMVWSTFFGGYNADSPFTAYVDHQDNLFICGTTTSVNFPTLQLTGAYWQPTNGGSSDMYILKFNNTGVLLWSTYFGGNGSEGVTGPVVLIQNNIGVDSKNNLFITCCTSSTNFPTQQLTGAYWQPNNALGYTDMVIMKFDSLGALLWSTYYGGSMAEDGCSLSIDSHDDIYITGFTTSFNFPTQQILGEYWQAANAGQYDAVLLKFNNSGVRLWSTYYGTYWHDDSFGSVIDKNDIIYVIGDSYGGGAYTVNPGNGAYYNNSWNGSGDSFILKFEMCNNLNPTSIQTNKNNLCIYDTSLITLSVIGGDGDTLKWYKGGCGQTYVGMNSPLNIHVPAQTTTYYARWESSCDTSACDSITINILPFITNNLNPVICNGQSYYVGNHVYNTSGLYHDTLTSVFGCDSIINTNLTVGLNYVNTINPVICQGNSFHIGYHTYFLSGTYVDTLLTHLVCDSIVITNLLVNPKKQVTVNPVICQGDSFQVGTNTYSVTGVYTNTLTTYLGCDSIITCNLTVNPVKQLTIYPTICQGDVFQVGTSSYSVTGIYSDTLSTFLGCDSIVTCNLTVNPVRQINIYPVICQDQVFQIGTNIYSKAGIYHDTISTYLGCDSIVTTNLTITAFPEVNLGLDTIICKGETLVLNAEIANAIYQWQDESVNPTYIVSQQGLYWVKTTIGNCYSTDSIYVITNDCEVILQLPNIITPNGDGMNDIFMPIISKNIKKMETVIYNRWGNLMYETDNLNIEWDGTFNGKYVADGVYYWIINYSDFDGKENFIRGSLTVMK